VAAVLRDMSRNSTFLRFEMNRQQLDFLNKNTVLYFGTHVAFYERINLEWQADNPAVQADFK
jgi:hypothetical protein